MAFYPFSLPASNLTRAPKQSLAKMKTSITETFFFSALITFAAGAPLPTPPPSDAILVVTEPSLDAAGLAAEKRGDPQAAFCKLAPDAPSCRNLRTEKRDEEAKLECKAGTPDCAAENEQPELEDPEPAPVLSWPFECFGICCTAPGSLACVDSIVPSQARKKRDEGAKLECKAGMPDCAAENEQAGLEDSEPSLEAGQACIWDMYCMAGPLDPACDPLSASNDAQEERDEDGNLLSKRQLTPLMDLYRLCRLNPEIPSCSGVGRVEKREEDEQDGNLACKGGVVDYDTESQQLDPEDPLDVEKGMHDTPSDVPTSHRLEQKRDEEKSAEHPPLRWPDPFTDPIVVPPGGQWAEETEIGPAVPQPGIPWPKETENESECYRGELLCA